MQQPLVSVVIATYNGKKKRFTQTIESILNQTYKNIELIIINDASTNNIEDVILEYKIKYSNIIYLKNEKNSERSYSRNRGIFESKGKYIAFCDDDDIWSDKDKIEKQVYFLESHNDYVLCGTSLITIDENNNQLNKVTNRSGNKNLKLSLLQSNQFALSSVIIKKDILGHAGLFNSNFNSVEDYDLRLRIGRYGKIDNIHNSYIWYRIRQGNTTTTSNTKQKKLSFKSMRNNKNYYPNFLKATLLRIGDFLLPTGLSVKILRFLKKFGLLK